MQPGSESQAQVFWKIPHAMPGRYLQSSCSLTGTVYLDLLNFGEAVDRLKDCFLPLPLVISALVDTDSQLSLDAPFLGRIQARYMPMLMTPCHLSCFSTTKWSKHRVLTVSTHKGQIFRTAFSKKSIVSFIHSKKMLIASEYGILACPVFQKSRTWTY